MPDEVLPQKLIQCVWDFLQIDRALDPPLTGQEHQLSNRAAMWRTAKLGPVHQPSAKRSYRNTDRRVDHATAAKQRTEIGA